MKILLYWYLVTVALLGIFHLKRKWAKANREWYDRFTKDVRLRKHEPSFIGGIIVAFIGYAMIWASLVTPPDDPAWTVTETSIAAFTCITLCLLVIFSLGANIAISPDWSRSYPLLIVYFAALIMIFGRMYSAFGMLDEGKATSDYSTGVYLSVITLTNLGSGDVVPSSAGRFVVVTEALIGYAALAFSTALVFTTIQRGMRSQIKAYDKLKRAREMALKESTATSASTPSG
jgi:hypothetical protein